MSWLLGDAMHVLATILYILCNARGAIQHSTMGKHGRFKFTNKIYFFLISKIIPDNDNLTQ